jgi:butyrate kinase
MHILVINPGSTSTKIAVFKRENQIIDETIRHSVTELLQFDTILDQKEFRFKTIVTVLSEKGFKIEDIDAVAARGGITKPIPSGTYEINEAMVRDLNGRVAALHASCLAGLIGYDLKQKFGIPAYIADPVVVDEMQAIAKLTGVPTVDRVSIFHALNQKAIARKCAKDMGRQYEDCRFVVAHMGGGISVAAHEKGCVIDVNNAISGEGPFSPERCGTLTALTVANLIFNQGYSEQDIKDLTSKRGGMVAYLNTNDMRDCEQMIAEGNEKAKLVFDAMAYQVAKEIGSMIAALSGEVDAIVLTGGLAYSKAFTQAIIKRVGFASEVKLYPGEFEVEALATSVLGVLNKRIKPKIYV